MQSKTKKFILELSRRAYFKSLIAAIFIVLGIAWKSGIIFAAAPLIFITKNRTIALIALISFLTGSFALKFHTREKFEAKSIEGLICQKNENQLKKFPFSYKVQSQNKNLLIYSKKSIGNVGDKIQLSNCTITKPKCKEFEKYLQKEKVDGTIFIGNRRLKISRGNTLSINKSTHDTKNRVVERIGKKLDPETCSLFSSIFLGEKSRCNKEYNEFRNEFKKWGLSHLLARSGLHLIIFLLSITILLTLVQVPIYLQTIIQSIALLIYYFLSWPSTSFRRAALFFAFWQICHFFELQKNYLHILNLTCILSLLINPYLLFFLDFQLSFGLTYALALLVESNYLFKSNC